MKKLLQILLIVFVLAGCSTGPIIPSQTPSNNLATPAVLAIPPTVTLSTISPEVTSTPILQPISEPTAIDDQNAGVDSKCIEVSQDLLKDQMGNGVAVLEDQRIGADNLVVPGFYLLNMKTGASINLSRQGERFLNGSVSPDGTLLSVEAGFSKLLIMLADGKVKKELPLGKGWGSNGVWQDNQHLMIDIAGLDPDESRALKPGKLLWLDPFTGEKRILAPNFPNIYNGYPLPNWGNQWGHSLVVYNPSLTRAVYLSDWGINYVLWDMQKKKPLMSWTQFANAEQNIPRWSPDGEKFIMYGILGKLSTMPEGPYLPYKLYLVDNDGNFSQLASVSVNLQIDDYFWSPSGRYIALTLLGNIASDGYYNDKLAVLDTKTKEITDYCVEFRPSGESEPSLIWSPDETQILLNDKYSQENRRVILVDLAKGTAFPIAQDMIATGWMKAP